MRNDKHPLELLGTAVKAFGNMRRAENVGYTFTGTYTHPNTLARIDRRLSSLRQQYLFAQGMFNAAMAKRQEG